jgi:hypothetical protein
MRHKNLVIEAPDSAEAGRFVEEYKSLGYHVLRDGLRVTILTLPPAKPKRKEDKDRE